MSGIVIGFQSSTLNCPRNPENRGMARRIRSGAARAPLRARPARLNAHAGGAVHEGVGSPRRPKLRVGDRRPIDAEHAVERLQRDKDYGRDPRKDPIALAAREAARLAWFLGWWAENVTLLEGWIKGYPASLSEREERARREAPPGFSRNDDETARALAETSMTMLNNSFLVRELTSLSDEASCAVALLSATAKRLAIERNRLNLAKLIDHRPKGQGASPKTMPERSFAFVLKYLLEHDGRTVPSHEVVRLVAIALQIAPADDRVDRWQRICKNVSMLSFDPNTYDPLPVEVLYLAGYAYPLKGQLRGDFERVVTHQDVVRSVLSK